MTQTSPAAHAFSLRIAFHPRPAMIVQRHLIAVFFVLVLVPAVSPAPKKATPSFDLVVEGLPNGSSFPARFTCDAPGGNGVSPALRWSGEPSGTQSFALIMEDPDSFGFVHWLLWDIPSSLHSLQEGAKPEGVPGTNGLGDRGYGGPCPPGNGGTHTYFLRMFALDVPTLGLKAGKGRDALEQAMRKHILARAEYRLRYGHRG